MAKWQVQWGSGCFSTIKIIWCNLGFNALNGSEVKKPTERQRVMTSDWENNTLREGIATKQSWTRKPGRENIKYGIEETKTSEMITPARCHDFTSTIVEDNLIDNARWAANYAIIQSRQCDEKSNDSPWCYPINKIFKEEGSARRKTT